MCPACLTAAAYWLVGGASGGGVAALAFCKWRGSATVTKTSLAKMTMAKTTMAKEQSQATPLVPLSNVSSTEGK